MRKPVMFRSRLISVVAASIFGSSVAITPAMAAGGGAGADFAARVQLAQACSTYGPFATIRRANEVAGQARFMGFNTQVFHNGDGYYVRIC